jgi:hypothetical protein
MTAFPISRINGMPPLTAKIAAAPSSRITNGAPGHQKRSIIAFLSPTNEKFGPNEEFDSPIRRPAQCCASLAEPIAQKFG